MDQKQEQRIETWLQEHKEALIADISRLVRIRSVSDAKNGTPEAPFGTGCRAALDEMLKIGEEHGFRTKNYDNMVGSLCLEEGEWENTIGFWGHLDVVPEGADWDFEPYNPIFKDGYLIGRGAGDNKGPTIGMLYVMQCLSELGVEMKHHLKLFVGCDEEKGMQDLIHYAETYPCPGMSMIADCGFPVCYGEKGILEGNIKADRKASKAIKNLQGGVASNMVADTAVAVLDANFADAEKLMQIGEKENYFAERNGDEITITAKGISKHTAFPDGGVNAIRQLCVALCESGALPAEDVELLGFMNHVNQDFCGTGLNVVFADEVSGPLTCVGSMASMEDGHLIQHFNIRYSVTADSEQLVKNITESAAAFGWHLDTYVDNKPNYFPKEHPAVALLTNVYNEAVGLETAPYVMGGGTYARKLPRAFAYGMGGIPGNPAPEGLFRPGHGGAHCPDEGLEIDRLLKGMAIYCKALIALNDIDLIAE